MKNGFVIYTALFGDYDDLVEPRENYAGCDFICFTDQKHLKSDIWDIKLVEDSTLPPNMMNRRIKILPHLYLAQYNKSLYLDSNIYIRKNPIELANKYLKEYDIVAPKHFSRDCIYQEAEECIKYNKSDPSITHLQMEHYKNQGYPARNGLLENNLIFRNHNKQNVVALMHAWFDELVKWTQRDQLSLMYLLWKHRMNFLMINETARGGKYFRILIHKNMRKSGAKGLCHNIWQSHIDNNPNSRLVRLRSFLGKLKYSAKF